MANTSKAPTLQDHQQTLEAAFNDSDKSYTVSGFVSAKVGHKVLVTYPSASTEQYEFLDVSTSLYTILLTYTDGTKTNLLSAERTA